MSPLEVADTSPAWMPIRTRTCSSLGHANCDNVRWISSAAATPALGVLKTAKNESPRTPCSSPPWSSSARRTIRLWCSMISA